MAKKKNILWDIKAKESLDFIYEYIAKDSLQAAKYVKKELVLFIATLYQFPEKYSKEEYLKHEPEDFRSVSKWNYKIIYEITEKSIIIIDIFHTSQNPVKIKKRN